MKIGIIDADLMDNGTRHPNLALMKISGFYKSAGNEVKLIYQSYDEIKNYDQVFISKVFNFTKVPDWVLREKNVKIGGTGFFEDGGENLPEEIEHHMPDYYLYSEYIQKQIECGKNKRYFEDYLEYSIGFLTRGCFRKCSFCVNKKYNHAFKHSPIEEFLDESRPKIYLWDDNFLAYDEWETCLDHLEKVGKPFQFRQGIDIRLMNDRKAYRFNNTKWNGDFIFAFDHLNDREVICKNIQLWKKYTNKQPKLYVLCGFNSQDQNDIADIFERIKLLMKYGCVPYIMRYEDYKKSKYKGMYIQIARWCNQPQFYKKMSFREFCERNQFYHSNKSTLCAAYKDMLYFENEHPNIAKQYFDLKYTNENIYEMNYGIGHRYYNKPECQVCKGQKRDWDQFLKSTNKKDELVQLYLEREVEFRCLSYKNSECESGIQNCVEYTVDLLLNTSLRKCQIVVNEYKEYHKLLRQECIVPKLTRSEIENLLNAILMISKNKILSTEILFCEMRINSKKEIDAYKRKFLELAMLDLLYYSKNARNQHIEVSAIGKKYLTLSEKNREKLLKRLQFRFPLVQKYYQVGEDYEKAIDSLHLDTKINKDLKKFLNKPSLNKPSLNKPSLNKPS